MEIFIIWLLFGIASAVVASNKGRSSCPWSALGVLLGPFGFILALAVSTNQKVVEKEAVQSGSMKKRHPTPKPFLLGIIIVFLTGLLIIGSNGCGLPVIPPETLMTTYSDSRYGFTIQHPFDCWMVQKGNAIVLAGSGFLSFTIVVTETEKSLQDWYLSLMNKVVEKEKVDELRVSSAWGEMIITRQCQKESGMLLKQMFLVSQGYGYDLQFSAPLEPSDLLVQLEPIIDAMIQSFSLQKLQTTADSIGSQSQPPSLWEAPPPGWEQIF